jgi:glycosyltransferase involved in cell wall biosynthesis
MDMKLGMLIPEFPTQTHVFFWREIEALRELGIDVHIISTKRPAETCPHEFAQIAIEQTHYVYPPSKWAIALSLFHILGVVRSLVYILSLSESAGRKVRALGYLLCAMDLAHYARKHQLDHIHVHSCADAAHIVAMASIMSNTPYSLHLHGDLPVYGKDHVQKMARAAFVSAAAKPMQRQAIEQAKVPEEKTYTMWMGVDTSQFSPKVDKPARQGAFHLVSVGRLHLCKGHRYTLQAIRKLLDTGADIRYTIGGSGPHQKEIADAVAEGNFGDRVRMVGSLGEAEVRELLNSADAFVLSSIGLGEASPVAVMEAMAAGVPVISSIIGGTPDMITNGIDGLLVAQEDSDALATAIQKLHDNETFRLQLATAARLRACEQFDFHVTSRKLLSAIKSNGHFNS